MLGHSERREYFNETDRALAEKVAAALGQGLRPILCVGETEEERDREDTERKLRHQINEDLAGVPVEPLIALLAVTAFEGLDTTSWTASARPAVTPR